MRFLLLGWGSRGDVEPFVALGLGLRAAGHDVAIAAGRDYAGWIESFGLTCEPFDVDMQEAMRSAMGRRWLGAAGPVAELRAMSVAVRDFAQVATDGLLRMVRPDDVVVSSALTFDAMLAIARVRGCRHVTALFAAGLPTRSAAASLAPVATSRDTIANLIAGFVAIAGMHRVMAPAGRLVRQRLGEPRETLWHYGRQGMAVPVLLAASPIVVPPPPDWGPRVRVCGYWPLPAPEAAQIAELVPPQVHDFLQAGPRPVYLGFGSMTSADPAATTALLLQAVRRAGVRAIIHRGVDGLGADGVPPDLADRVLFVGSVPHAWLLPRCAAAVVHGGAGSTAAGLRAGIPTMAVPHIGDQSYWGRRLHEVGVGPAPIHRSRLTAPALAAAVTTLTTDRSMAARAAEIAAALAREDGVADAVTLLENHVAHTA